jgi:hypothetical protein
MALSFAIQDYIEGGVISAVILLNIVVGYVARYILRYASLFSIGSPKTTRQRRRSNLSKISQHRNAQHSAMPAFIESRL